MLYYLTDKNYESLKTNPNDGDYCGSFYYGALCFDIVPRQYTSDSFIPGYADENNMVVDLDLYILGVDDGYGMLDDGTPYSYYEYCGPSVPCPKSASKQEFIKKCNDVIVNFIETNFKVKEYFEHSKMCWVQHERPSVLKDLEEYKEKHIKEEKQKEICVETNLGNIIVEPMGTRDEYPGIMVFLQTGENKNLIACIEHNTLRNVIQVCSYSEEYEFPTNVTVVKNGKE